MSKRRPIMMGHAERVALDVEAPCSTPLTRSVLDRACRPGTSDTVHSITPKCHPDSGIKIWYRPADGCAVLLCSKCGAGVARMQLAVEAPS